MSQDQIFPNAVGRSKEALHLRIAKDGTGVGFRGPWA